MKCVISVLGKDRSGIVAAVSVALAECGANIDDISQTILGEMFSMTMLTTLDTEKADFNAVQERLDAVHPTWACRLPFSAKTCSSSCTRFKGRRGRSTGRTPLLRPYLQTAFLQSAARRAKPQRRRRTCCVVLGGLQVGAVS